MPLTDKMQQYTAAVCEQVRWGRAHAAIAAELESHMLDQYDAYCAQGMQEEAAAAQAVAQMGDPVEVGVGLDRTHRPRPQWGLLALVVLLLVAGIVIIWQISVTPGIRFVPNPYRTIAAAVVGGGLLLAAYLADFTLLGKRPLLVYTGVVGLGLLLTLVAGQLQFYSTQSTVVLAVSPLPAYLALFFPLAFALVVYRLRGGGLVGILLCGAAILPPVLYCMLAAGLSLLLTVLLCGLGILTLAISWGWFGCSKRQGLALVWLPVGAAVGLFFVWLQSTSRWQQLLLRFQPELDPYGYGYQTMLIRDLLGSAKLVGCGTLPPALAPLSYFALPGLESDTLLTYIIWRWGWLAGSAVVALLATLIGVGLWRAWRQRSMLGRLVAFSTLLLLGCQLIGFLLWNLGFPFPILGPVLLPLISYGGVVTVINLLLIGLMLSALRSGEVALDRAPVTLPRYKLRVALERQQ